MAGVWCCLSVRDTEYIITNKASLYKLCQPIADPLSSSRLSIANPPSSEREVGEDPANGVHGPSFRIRTLQNFYL
jgi:hypothetical protein